MNRTLKLIILIFVLILYSQPLTMAQDSTLEYSNFSTNVQSGDYMIWEITNFEIESSFADEFTDTEYPLVRQGSKIKVEILQDIGNLQFDIHGSNNEFDPNEYFKESVDGSDIELQDHYYSPQIFVETSKFNSDGTLNRRTVGTIDLILPVTYFYSNGSSFDLVEYIRSVTSSVGTINNKESTIEFDYEDLNFVYHKETGIVLEGTTQISTTDIPIMLSFKLIEYNGDADIAIQSDESLLSWQLNFLFIPIGILILFRNKQN